MKNEKQYEGLKKKGMSKGRAARIVQAWWEEVRVRLTLEEHRLAGWDDAAE